MSDQARKKTYGLMAILALTPAILMTVSGILLLTLNSNLSTISAVLLFVNATLFLGLTGFYVGRWQRSKKTPPGESPGAA